MRGKEIMLNTTGDAFSDLFSTFLWLGKMGGVVAYMIVLLPSLFSLTKPTTFGSGMFGGFLFFAPIGTVWVLGEHTKLGYEISPNMVLTGVFGLWFLAFVVPVWSLTGRR